MRYLVLPLVLLLSGALVHARTAPQVPAPVQIEVPAQMDFCGMKLTFTAGARAQIQGYVNSLTRSPSGYQTLVQRGATFLPHISDAFRHMGTPEDLIYIAIQESALQGDAVSRSNAVGFWQFKAPTARAMGLVVDDHLDERKHLTRASLAAARYLRQNYDQTGNWFYAVVSYMTGPTGALPYIRENYRHAQRMTVTEDDHWYALKVLAHILAFRAATQNATPTLWLEAKSLGEERSLWQVLEAEKLARITWAPYNLWAVKMRVPTDRPMTHFLPRQGVPYRHVPDPHLALFTPPGPWQRYTSTPIPELPQRDTTAVAADTTDLQAPKEAPAASPANASLQLRPLSEEPYHHVAFVFLAEAQTLRGFASATGMRFKDLRKYNRQLPTDTPLRPGMRILLQPPKEIPVHICLPGETLADIAALYGLSVADLLVRNLLSARDAQLVPGLKLYIYGRKPVSEGRVVYRLPFED